MHTDHVEHALLSVPAVPFPALATRLKGECASWPTYGLPFAIALDQAVRHVERGAVYERLSPVHFRIRALPLAIPYRVSLGACACPTPSPWCWHRGLVHFLIASEVRP